MAIKYTRLPDKLYRVRVPLMATYTDLELEIMGTPVLQHSSGRMESIDEAMTVVTLPLTRIIDIYSTGSKIGLIDEAEVLEIYQALENYLHDTNSVTPELNSASNEDDRDLDIDRFASELFGLNRDTIVNATYNKKSGFDIGIHKLDLHKVTNRPSRRRRNSITEAYMNENPNAGPTNNPNAALDEVYLTHQTNYVDPDSVIRKPTIRKRQKLKPPGDLNA